MTKKWNKSTHDIKKFFKSYSAEDVASSLFILSLWLPNLPGQVKSLYLTLIYANLKPPDFLEKNRINNYSDFKNFSVKLLKLIPDFPFLEDYIPELDWGNVKYFFNDNIYKIFYGGFISQIYDFLSAYEVLYCHQNKTFENKTKRSPSKDLKECLEAQTWIINKINTQNTDDTAISLGNYERPTKLFWGNAIQCFKEREKLLQILGNDDFIVNQGDSEDNLLNYENFSNGVMEGSFLLGYFIKNGDNFFPILPRRFSEVLIEKWSSLFFKSKLNNKEKVEIQRELTFNLVKFIVDRFSNKEFVPFVCAIKDNYHPGELTYCGYFLGKNKLTLIYAADPYTSKDEANTIINDLENKLKSDLSLLSKEPLTLGIISLRKNVQFKSENNEKLEIEIIVVLSQATTKMIPVKFPRIPNVRIVFLDQFLGVMDEIEKASELTDFLSYLSSIETQIKIPITTFLDKFASFKHSKGVLVYSANEPDFIMLDFQSGSNYRFISLSKFWRKFPKQIAFLGNPRSWTITDYSKNLRISAKNERSMILYAFLNDLEISITAPFSKLEYEQGAVADLLVQLLQDYFIRFGNDIEKHIMCKIYNSLHIIIFPEILLENSDFKHIRHLSTNGNIWNMDIGVLKAGYLGMRIVFSENKVMNAFDDVKTNNIEQRFFRDVLNKINLYIQDDLVIEKLTKILDKELGNLPRFTLIKESKTVAFPDFVNPNTPTDHEHKLSRKRIAQLALEAGIKPGFYSLKEAPSLLCKLRSMVISEINSEVKKYPYKESILYLISITDALIHDFERKKIILKKSVQHDVDYSRTDRYASLYNDFVHDHKNNRYLIEKFFQLKPSGKVNLNPDKSKYLLALVDKLLEISSASDNLHYNIFQTGLNISRNFIVTVQYERNLESMDQLYGKHEAEVSLGLVGNELDRVNSEYPVEFFLNELDDAFSKDFGFSLKDLVNALQTLSQWPQCKKGEKESTLYNAPASEINNVFKKVIKHYKSDTKKILDFITLSNKNLLKITDRVDADDIPVWEHNKRPYRYTLKPLMCYRRRYFWGPHSTDNAARTWMNISSTGILPYKIDASDVNRILIKNQRSVQKELEKKALEITRRFTPHADRVNHSRGTHPKKLGEFDVLAYLENENIFLNIECKDIVGAYCLKDAKTLKDKIFRLDKEKDETGKIRDVKNPGNLLIVEKREKYLKRNYKKVAKILKWPSKDRPKVITLYITRQNYWWTFYPPRKTSAVFMRIDLLDSYIKSLKK